MIGVFAETGLASRQFFKMAFRRFRPAPLQALTKIVVPLSVLLHGVPAKGLTGAIGGKIDDAQIHAQRVGHLVRRGRGNIQRHRKEERPVPIEQVGLSLDLVKTGCLRATEAKRNQHPTGERQKRDLAQSLQGHQTLVIGDCPLATEGWFDALVTRIRLSGLADCSDRHLRRERELLTHLGVDQLLQLELIRQLLIKSHLSNRITRIIEGVHGLKQRVVLFWRWGQFQEHRLFHAAIIAHGMYKRQ